MDPLYRKRLLTHLTGQKWYYLLGQDIQRILELADRVVLDVVPRLPGRTMSRTITMDVGCNRTIVNINGNYNNYNVSISPVSLL